MAITYNAGTSTITVTGYTSGTPCTFLDVYNADVAGAWGKVSRQGTDQYYFTAFLTIGDGSTATWFADVDTQVIWNVGAGNMIYVDDNAHFRLGTLVDDAAKQTKQGCSIMYIGTSTNVWIQADTTSAYWESYSCMFSAPNARSGFMISGAGLGFPSAKMYNCVGYNWLFGYMQSTSNYYNIYTHNYSGLQALSSYGGTLDIFISQGSRYGIYFDNYGANNTIFKNMKIRNSTDYSIRTHATAKDFIILNGDLDAWTFWFYSSPNCICYRKYEFDLKVIDKDNVAINGATVKVWDKDSNLIVDTTTNASGVITTQTITRGYYNQTNGDTLQEASPHLIKIEKAGYTTYEADFTLGDKIDWLIALQAAGGGLLRNPPMTGGMV